MNPAAKSLSMPSAMLGFPEVTSEYRIIGRLGGKSRPRLPDVVTSPSENRSGYFSLSRIGYRSPPRAMIVTPEPPVNAVNAAHVTSTTIASPP